MSETTCKKVLAQVTGKEYVPHSCQCSSCQLDDKLYEKAKSAETQLTRPLYPVKGTSRAQRRSLAMTDVLTGPKEIKIVSADQIVDRLIHDGDLREHDFDYPYICCEGDDLGFYQQGCEFLVHKLEDLEEPKHKNIQERLTANAEDFDGIVSDMLEKLAEIQTCKQGHQFVAKSHEYVCPSCQLDEVRKHLS